jgi:predicted aminopeptidase
VDGSPAGAVNDVDAVSAPGRLRASSVVIVVAVARALLLSVAAAGCAHATEPEPSALEHDDPVEGLRWLAQQGLGQAELLWAARPAAPLLRDPDVPADVRRRLAIVAAARDFARDRLGLAVGAQYRRVVFLDAPAVVYVVSAAEPDRLEPFTWRYPVVGALPYRGFFSLADAEALADRLARRALDVSVRPVTTYSLLGFAPDPVVSPMLYRRDELDIVETVVHELAHATVFAAGQGAFNEGLATFIGRAGRRQFVRERFGPTSAVARRSEAQDGDDDAWARAVAALAFDLRVLYAQRASSSPAAILDEKRRTFARHQRHWQQEVAPTLFSMRLRAARLPDNNAELAAVGIYSLRQQVYAQAFAGCGESWRCFVRLLRSVADAPDPEEALAAAVPPPRREVLLP